MRTWTFGFEVESYHDKYLLRDFVFKYDSYFWDDVHQDSSGPYEINAKPFDWLEPKPAVAALELNLPCCDDDNVLACGNHFHVKYQSNQSNEWSEIVSEFWIHLYALSVLGYKFLAAQLTEFQAEFQAERREWAAPTTRLPYGSKWSLLTLNDSWDTLENRACEASPLRCYLLHWLAVALWELGVRLNRCISVEFLRDRWDVILDEPTDRNAYLPPRCPLRTPNDLYRYAAKIYEQHPEYRVRDPPLPIPKLFAAVLYDANPLRNFEDLEPLLDSELKSRVKLLVTV